ncbi:MAG: YihY/virulence factor BrkB family protein [Planctomycetota bacterium]|nr:YihY/virulence factor BrkB family protein [Planctomycetota bacterium]
MAITKKNIERRTIAERVARHGVFGRVLRFFEKDAWSHERVASGNVFFRAARILYLAGRGFLIDNCLFRASALTYITVLSLVPLLAFSFSVAKGFGFYADLLRGTINPFLDRTFGAASGEADILTTQPAAPEIRSAIARILEFVDKTDVSALGFFGLALLLFTVLKLLSTIERSFNDIWGVQRSRTLVRKVSDYLAMVVVTPIILFIAAGLTTAAQNSAAVEGLAHEFGLGGAVRVVLSLMPFLALFFGFTFIYMAMPNTKTKFRSALIGGLVAGTLWQITLIVHLKFQIGIANYNAIYSSFAAFPIFLVWINISWVIVLLGAEISFAHQSEPAYAHVEQSELADHAFKERLGLRALTRIGSAFLEGRPPLSASALALEMAAPQRVLEEVLYVFVDHGLLAVTNEGEEHAFLPAKDLDSITVKSVIDALKGTAGPLDPHAMSTIDAHIDRILVGLDEENTGSRHNRTLKALAEAALRDGMRGENAVVAGRLEQGPLRA